MKKLLPLLFAPLILIAADKSSGTNLIREVRHELVTLPYYGIFDDLSYRVDGDKVTLFGQVTKPTLKTVNTQ